MMDTYDFGEQAVMILRAKRQMYGGTDE